MIKETRLVRDFDMQTIMSAVLNQQNELGNRMVGVIVEEKQYDYHEVQMIFDTDIEKKVNQKILVSLVEKRITFLYADAHRDEYLDEGYELTILEISNLGPDAGMNFVLMIFEKPE